MADDNGSIEPVQSIETENQEQPTKKPEIAERSAGNKPLWELIPDNGYDRKLVELWSRGETVPNIAKKIGREPKTIEGRITKLRQQYQETIPNLLPERK